MARTIVTHEFDSQPNFVYFRPDEKDVVYKTGSRVTHEAHMYAQLTTPHPHVIQCFGLTPHNELKLQRIQDGTTLRNYLSALYHDKHKPRLSTTLALQWALEVSLALNHLHQHRILHHDFCPENLLVETDAEGLPHKLYLMDLDAAELLSPDTLEGDPTQRFRGHPHLAPEQAEDSTEPITTAFDICGLGHVFFALIQGTYVVYNLRTEVPLSTLADYLRRLAFLCLQESPQDRPSLGDIIKIVQALNTIAQDTPEHAETPALDNIRTIAQDLKTVVPTSNQP